MASLSGGGRPDPPPPPALQLRFRRRCSHIKTPHQLLQETGNYYMHIVFLQCWHTLVHRPASLCIFFLGRGREGRKPPDKKKFCNRSSAARVSPTRSPLFPIISFSLSHRLSGCTTAVRPFWLSFVFFPLLLHLFRVKMCKLLSRMHVSSFQRQARVIAYFADGGGGVLLETAHSGSVGATGIWLENHHHSSNILRPPHPPIRAHTEPSIPDLYV